MKVVEKKIERKKKRIWRRLIWTIIVLCIGVYIGKNWEELKAKAEEKVLPKLKETKDVLVGKFMR